VGGRGGVSCFHGGWEVRQRGGLGVISPPQGVARGCIVLSRAHFVLSGDLGDQPRPHAKLQEKQLSTPGLGGRIYTEGYCLEVIVPLWGKRGNQKEGFGIAPSLQEGSTPSTANTSDCAALGEIEVPLAASVFMLFYLPQEGKRGQGERHLCMSRYQCPLYVGCGCSGLLGNHMQILITPKSKGPTHSALDFAQPIAESSGLIFTIAMLHTLSKDSLLEKGGGVIFRMLLHVASVQY